MAGLLYEVSVFFACTVPVGLDTQCGVPFTDLWYKALLTFFF